jgi:hypothetical protein
MSLPLPSTPRCLSAARNVGSDSHARWRRFIVTGVLAVLQEDVESDKGYSSSDSDSDEELSSGDSGDEKESAMRRRSVPTGTSLPNSLTP